MRTKRHIIRGASLSNIEKLSDELVNDTPDWVPATVAIEGTETSALDAAMVETKHFSGLLRECSRSDNCMDGQLEAEDGSLHDLYEMLDESAERLDQAHEEWLQAEVDKQKAPKRKVVEIEVRNVYGIDRFYPANELANELAEMCYGRKTINQEDLIKMHKYLDIEVCLTNAVAHNWLPFATSKLEIAS